MDLKDLKPKIEVLTVKVEHPHTGEVLKNEDGSDMEVTLLSPSSKAYREVLYERADERLRKAAEKGEEKLSAKAADMASIEILTKVTSGWNITYGGETPEFSQKLAFEVYDELRWLKQQLENALNDVQDFI